MSLLRSAKILTSLLLGIVFGATASFAAGPAFQVTITNLTGGPGGQITTPNGMSTGGQEFTPILVASHKAGVTLFTLGQPASVALQDLAESGDTSMLKSTLTSNPDVLDVETTDPNGLMPGQSVSVTVKTAGRFSHISLASMLVPTNDGFVALNDEPVPAVERVSLFIRRRMMQDPRQTTNCARIFPVPPTYAPGQDSSRRPPELDLFSSIVGFMAWAT
jgi:hypothetical protein